MGLFFFFSTLIQKSQIVDFYYSQFTDGTTGARRIVVYFEICVSLKLIIAGFGPSVFQFTLPPKSIQPQRRKCCAF